MNYLRVISSSARGWSACRHRQPVVNKTFKRFKKSSACSALFPPDRKPCFDVSTLSIERGNLCHGKLIKSFLYSEHWPREPTVTSLWMSLDSQYLDVMSDKYSYSGDRFVALECLKRTGERKLVGVAAGSKIYPWVPGELEEWAHFTGCKPDRHRMFFFAHCYRSPNFFKKYKVDFIYEVEVLATAAEVTGQGVATRLLLRALEHAKDLKYPLTQVIATSTYTAKICERCGMTRAWVMAYDEFIDERGQRVFFTRRPHTEVAIYVKRIDPCEMTNVCTKVYPDTSTVTPCHVDK